VVPVVPFHLASQVVVVQQRNHPHHRIGNHKLCTLEREPQAAASAAVLVVAVVVVTLELAQRHPVVAVVEEVYAGWQQTLLRTTVVSQPTVALVEMP
jgi:hypothetical protein